MTAEGATALGIDVGGTAIKIGLVDAEGSIRARRQVPFDQALSFDELAGAIATAAEAVCAAGRARPCAAGVATPGFADAGTGVLIDGTNNVPALKGRSLPGALAPRLGCPVVIDNDALAAAHGELRFGAGRRFARFVLVTIGTGIGGGVVIDGRVLRGSAGEPPEIGALVLDPSGERNYSGLPGTFEHLACADALVRGYGAGRAAPAGRLTAADVFARARGGDEVAAAAVDAVCRRIAQALGIMINLLNLDACILGGGIAGAGEALLVPVRRHLLDFTWPLLLERAQIVLAERGNDAGLLGAAALALDRFAARELTSLKEL